MLAITYPYYSSHILRKKSNLFYTHDVFLVSVLRSTPDHTPIKYRRPINM